MSHTNDNNTRSEASGKKKTETRAAKSSRSAFLSPGRLRALDVSFKIVQHERLQEETTSPGACEISCQGWSVLVNVRADWQRQIRFGFGQFGLSGPYGARVPETGQLQEVTVLPVRTQHSCTITVSDKIASLSSISRCDGGSDESIVSLKLAKLATLRGIGKNTAIRLVKLKVELKTRQDLQSFFFSRS